MASPFVIDVRGLRKSYGAVEALRGLSLDVPAGSICGLLGRNGSGKTTTIKILLGMARATAGAARAFGLDAGDPRASVEIRRRTGFVGEDKELYEYMTVDEIVRFTAAFYPRWRRDLERKYIRLFELPEPRRIKALSRGARTKLALLLALCRGAELLVLDEPTSGLDPAAAEQVLQALVAHAAAAELTVFFSSHQIAEVDQIADRVAIVDAGRTRLSSGLDDLRERYRAVRLVFEGPAPDVPLADPCVRRVRRNGRVLTVLSSAGAEPILELARPLNPRSVDVVPVTLKDIFLETIAEEE